jgi:hypothetical protein
MLSVGKTSIKLSDDEDSEEEEWVPLKKGKH